MGKNDESSDSSSSSSDESNVGDESNVDESNLGEKSDTEDKKSWEEESSSEEEEEEENDEKPSTQQESLVMQQEQNEKAASSGSSSESDSSSGESSASESQDEDGDGEEEKHSQNHSRTKKKDEDRKIWDENPDVYGIRRSNRQRKEPNRLMIQSESESEDDDGEKPKRHKKKSDAWIPTLSGSESEQSDSSYEAPKKVVKKRGRKPASTTTQRRRTQQRGRTLSTSSDELKAGGKKSGKRGKPASKRNASGNKVSYKEDSEGETDSDDLIEQDEGAADDAPAEDVETIEKVVRHRQGWPGQTGAKTTIYSDDAEEILKKGEPDQDKDETQLQYLIKWKSWSHLHNTWETRDDIITQGVKGLKKLDNYIKRMEEVNKWKSVSTPEDVEYFELQQEMNEDIQKQYQKVERIISHQFTSDSSSSYPDYYCKWQGLPYSECTWEDGTLTARFFQDSIDEYLERERSDTIPNKNAKCLRQRPKFSSFKSQPDFIGSGDSKLRDYQVDGVNWLVHAWCRDTSVILADEMGLGKTIQTISFLSYLFHKYSLYGPFLVVVPLSTMDAWEREFKIWANDMNVIVYIGDVNSRTMIQDYEWCFKKSRKLKFNVVLTTYEMLLRDKDFLGSLNWASLVIDEAHRLKNEDSLLYKVLIDFRTNFRFLITGTPLQNSLKELYSLLHFMMPSKFDDWEEFEGSYSVSDKEGLQKLHRDLEPFLLRRVKKDVEKSLPAKVEQILRVEMSQIQKQYYKLILTRNVQELCRELKGSFSGLLNIIVELKKCCNHGTLIKHLDPDAPDQNLLQTLIKGSGKMILLDKLLCRLKETGHRVLVFSQMVRMLDIIADYLYLKRFPFQRLDGSVRGEQRQRALDHFNAEGSQDFCFLLSTRAGGLGINLASADTVIIFDSDWNPQNDLQAMARAHRIGQKNQVNIYRFVTKNTIEENIIERAKKKMVLDHLIIQRMDTTGRRILSKSQTPSSNKNPFNKEELSSILKFGAEDLFRDHDQDSDQKLHAMDIDEILQRAEMQENAEDIQSANEDLLSQFKVVNYAAFDEGEITNPQAGVTGVDPPVTPMQKLWNEIIPEEDIRKAQVEKKDEETLQPRSRKAVEKMNIAPASTTASSNKMKSKEFLDTDSSSSSSSEGEDGGNAETKGKKKKKQISNVMKKEGVKGCTDQELRRFIKSFKKFSRPLTRLDAISQDAELTDKSAVELFELGDLLKKSCEQAVKEYQEKLLQDEEFGGKKKGASLKISGVTINAPSVLKAEVDLEPLATCLPPHDSSQLKSFRLTLPTRGTHWGISWGVVEDSMLLVGMLLYGMGNWEAIKSDQSLGLTTKILPVGNGKPQNKHLNSRGEYLLRLLREQDNTQQNVKTKKKKKTSKAEKTTSTDTKKGVPDEKPAVEISEAPKKEKKKKKEKTEKKKKKKEEKVPKNTKVDASLTKTSSTVSAVKEKPFNIDLIEIENMDDSTFKMCKEKMRAEKKSLQLLHQPDESATEETQVQTTKKCLLKIGDHIEKNVLNEYKDESTLEKWRSNMWSFVAKFTELGAQKLFKLYRTASRKRDDKKDKIKQMKANYTSTLQEVGKKITADKLELEQARKRALGIDGTSSANKIPKIEKMKIPHRSQQKHHQQHRSRYQHEAPYKHPHKLKHRDNQQWESRNRDEFSTKKDKRSWDSKSQKHSNNDNERQSNDENSNSALTYREWKEQQLKRAADDEKQKSDKRPSKALYKRDQRSFGEEKAPSHQKQHSNHDSYSYKHSRNAKSRDHYFEHSNSPSFVRSPSNMRSPSNTSRSPLTYGNEHQWSRKRTSSNNSDFQSSSNKRIYQNIEQISPSDSIGDNT